MELVQLMEGVVSYSECNHKGPYPGGLFQYYAPNEQAAIIWG